MIFALAGNQNCGKTTLFNQLTGSNQHVGNFPGVTVDQKSGPVRGQKDCTVVDLPGIYSLRPYTAEEIVTRDFILKNKPDGIINIVDATNLERNLYLTLQLLTLRVIFNLVADGVNAAVDRAGRAEIDDGGQAFVLRRVHGRLDQCLHAVAGGCTDWNDRHAQLLRKLVRVNAAAVAGQLVHHIERQHRRHAQRQ